MTREEIISMLNILLDNAKVGCADITVIHHVSFDSFKFVVEQAIKALEQENEKMSDEEMAEFRRELIDASKEPCEDAISRDAVLKRIAQFSTEEGSSVRVQPLYSDVYNMSSVTPSRRKGHWIKHPNGIYAHLVCDKCLSNAPYDIKTNYCPNCGAEMESEE